MRDYATTGQTRTHHEFGFLEHLEETVGVVVKVLGQRRLRLAVAVQRRFRQRRRRAAHLPNNDKITKV